jgi:diacylglycerol kinase (ATP)
MQAKLYAEATISSPVEEEKDVFTIGTEQVAVSLILLILSLILLSRSSHTMSKSECSSQQSKSKLKFSNVLKHMNPMRRMSRNFSFSNINTSNSRLYRWFKSDNTVNVPTLKKSKSTPLVIKHISPSSSMCTGILRDTNTNNKDTDHNDNDTDATFLDQDAAQSQTQSDSDREGCNNTNINSGVEKDDEFYTDHERFTNAYNNTVRHSDYRRLVLPPECKLIDPAKFQPISTNKTSPALSLAEIWIKIIEWIHHIISFDYIGYTVIFNYRILKAVAERVRKWKWLGIPPPSQEEDADDDDDDTVTSAGSRRSLASREGSVAGSLSFSVNQNVGVGGKQQGYVSALSTPTRQGKFFVDTIDAPSTLSTIPTTALSGESSIPIADTLCQDGGSVGGGSHASFKQRERFYTGDDHHLDPRDYGYSPGKSPSMRNRSPCPISRRPMSSVYDESFDSSTHSICSLSEDYDANMWIPSVGNLSGSNSSPIRRMSDEKKDHTGGNSSLYSLSSPLDEPSQGQQMGHKTKNKLLDSLSLPVLPPMLPPRQVQGIKRKDTLEKYRNVSTKSVIQSPPNSGPLIAPPEKRNLSERHQSHELQYFDTATNDASMRQIERAAPLPDREGYILGDQFLEDPRDTPLLVFVNTRSGSQQGLILKMQLRSLLNPIQIWDLADGGPEKILKSFSVLTRLRLLVCGGDGTVSWIISTLDKMNIERWPPIAILPLGTGNDLARIHGACLEHVENYFGDLCLNSILTFFYYKKTNKGWGAGYANESLLMILDQVKESYISLLDRWNLTIEEKKTKKNSKKKKAVSKPFINYMSIGMDAVSALQVHNLRENSPEMFFSRAINKFWYTIFGAEDAIKASCSDLPQQIILEADGVRIPIPEDSQGLIFLNIDSYLGGVPLWSRGVPIWQKKLSRRGRSHSEGGISGSDFSSRRQRNMSFGESEISVTADDDYNEETMEERIERIMACDTPSSCQDGKVDVISHKGNFNLGQIRVGLSNAQRLCQCSKVKIILKKGTSVQVDGEPWKQAAGVLRIERQKDPAVMLHRALEEGGGIETEVANLLEWAEEKNIIQRDTHATLMKEFSRRIEKKTRERRNKSDQNVFVTMKRRIASSHRLPTGSDYE